MFKLLIFFSLMGNLNIFSQDRIINDFNNDGFIDTLSFKVIRTPKDIPTYIKFVDGKTSSSLLIELMDGFDQYSLNESYMINGEIFSDDENFIIKIFSEIYDSKIEKLENDFNRCQYPQQGYELVDISSQNKYIDYYLRDSCFKYDSILPKFHEKYILVDDIKTLWVNGMCCDLSGEFDSNYKQTGKVLWHFWGEKINMNEFTQIKINDTISYYENFGCSFLKRGSQYTWINLRPQPNFWSEVNNKSFESKVILVQNYLFVKMYLKNEEFIEIININNGNRTTFSTKDFKDFNLNSANKLEIVKHYDVSEILVLSELLKGF